MSLISYRVFRVCFCVCFPSRGSYELFLARSNREGEVRDAKLKKLSWLRVSSIDDLEQKVGEIIVAVMAGFSLPPYTTFLHYTTFTPHFFFIKAAFTLLGSSVSKPPINSTTCLLKSTE